MSAKYFLTLILFMRMNRNEIQCNINLNEYLTFLIESRERSDGTIRQ